MSDLNDLEVCLSDSLAKTQNHISPPNTEKFSHPQLVPLAQDKVSADYVLLSRQIGRGCFVRLTSIGTDAILTVKLTNEVTEHTNDLVIFEGPFGSIEINDGARFVRALSGIDLGEEVVEQDVEMTESTKWLYSAAIGRMNETPFACTDSLIRSSLFDIQDQVVLRLSIKSSQHALTFYARASSETWLSFLSYSNWIKEQLPERECLGIPVNIPVLIARHKLPYDVIGALTEGDIIIPTTSYFMSSGEGYIHISGLSIQVVYDEPCRLKIISVEGKLEDENMDFDEEYQGYDDDSDEENQEYDEGAESDEVLDSNEAHESQDEQNGNNFSSLKNVMVHLDFQLGSTRMTLNELRTLGPGTVLLFEGGSPASIAIQSSGKTLGRGEVVDVSGQLGIRVIQWGNS